VGHHILARLGVERGQQRLLGEVDDSALAASVVYGLAGHHILARPERNQTHPFEVAEYFVLVAVVDGLAGHHILARHERGQLHVVSQRRLGNVSGYRHQLTFLAGGRLDDDGSYE